jgi:hypothetical protein
LSIVVLVAPCRVCSFAAIPVVFLGSIVSLQISGVQFLRDFPASNSSITRGDDRVRFEQLPVAIRFSISVYLAYSAVIKFLNRC